MSGAPLHANVRFWRDDALPGVEARSSTYRQKAFRTHTHRACIISLIDAGSTSFHLDGVRHTANAGHMVVIETGRPHACNPDSGSGISYRLLALDPRWLWAAAQQPGQAPRFSSPVLHDPELFAAWGELHQAYVQAAPACAKQSLLLACLRGLTARHADLHDEGSEPAPRDTDTPAARRGGASSQGRPAGGQTLNPAVAQAQAHIAAKAGAWVPLDELARLAGLSPHHFLRVFKAATGLPPHAYQLQQAVERAKTLLAGGMSISQAALDAGFADQSHFSRCFREFTGATPGQYLGGHAK